MNRAPDGNVVIIGGTGFEKLPPEIFAEPIEAITPFGSVSLLSLSSNYVEPNKLYFLSRHGSEHHLAPHQIDYRANIMALKSLGVRYAFATNAVGSLRTDLPPGSFVLLDDFIDFTRARQITLFSDANWKHIDFSTPYSPLLRDAVIMATQRLEVDLIPNGTYVCCDGPRFESPAEVRLFGHWGGDVVGMTGLPEAVFAREAGIEYAALTIVTNLGAGLSPAPVEHEKVSAMMQECVPLVRELLITASGILFEEP